MIAEQFGHPGIEIDQRHRLDTVAQHLAQGHGMAYNIGEPGFGTSSPLFTLLLAGLGHGLQLLVAQRREVAPRLDGDFGKGFSGSHGALLEWTWESPPQSVLISR